MQQKNMIRLLIVLLAGLLSFQVSAASSVWKISKGDHYFYLGGTIHVLNHNDYPLPQEYLQAYNDSALVYFEVDIDEVDTPEFQEEMMAAMMFQDGNTLAGALKPEIYNKLATFLAGRNIPVENFEVFQPWAVSLMVSVMEYMRMGMFPEFGVDQFFNNLAKVEKKPVFGLETAQEQLQFLLSMADVDPNISIEYTLRDLETLPIFIDTMKRSWRDGDLEAMANNEYIVAMKVEFPDMYETMLIIRNNAWMKKLVHFTDNEAVEFVLVGALHLPGEGGLIEQLAQQGFTIEQL